MLLQSLLNFFTDFYIMKYLLVFLLILASACDNEGGATVWNPDRPQAQPPVIQSVSPADSVIAGGEIMTITGQGFSTNIDSNYVSFGYGAGKVISASATQLRVIAPAKAIPAKKASISVKLKVGKFGVENWSNQLNYKLLAPFLVFNKKDFFEESLNDLYGMTTDVQNNIYANLYADGLSLGIYKFNTADTTRTIWSSTIFKFDDLYYNATDNKVYGVRGVRALFRFAQGGAQEVVAVEPDVATQLVALEKVGNTWYTGGNNAKLFAWTGTAWLSTPFAADVRALKTVGNTLYILAKQNNAWGIWKSDITGGTLGAPQSYVSLPQILSAENGFALEVFSNGDLLVGTDKTPDPVYLVKADKSIEVFYTGVFKPLARTFAIAGNNSLFMAKGSIGSTDKPNLLTINTGVRLTVR